MPSLTQIFTFILDALFSISCIFMPLARWGTPSVDSVANIFYPVALSETVLLVNPAGLSRDEFDMLVSLQGITAQDGEADIYLMMHTYHRYIEAYQAANPAQQFEEFEGTVWDLVERFVDEIPGRGFVAYNPPGNSQNPGINMAATIAAAEGWLGVPDSLVEQAEAAGLVLMRDLRSMSGSYANQQLQIFREFRSQLNNAMVVHQPPNNSALRDFGIAQRALTFFAPNDTYNNAMEYAREQWLLWSVASWLRPNASVFGVWGMSGELHFVRKISRASLHVLPADHLRNGSTLMGFAATEPIQQPYQNREITAQPGNHYIALMLSDGDNIQWLVGNAFFNGFIYDRLQTDDTFPISLTYAPLMAQLYPFVVQYHYGLLTPGLQMICGVSGLGYTNITMVPASTRHDYARLTAEAMEMADLRVMQLLDDLSLVPGLIGGRPPGLRGYRIINDFLAQEQITGGIWYMDPGRYESGQGRVYRGRNDKVFVTNRISFWSPDGTYDGSSVTPEWIQEFADTINAFPRDPSRADGFSVINIHPWSIRYHHVQELVSLLDDHVVLLSAEEFVGLAAENIR